MPTISVIVPTYNCGKYIKEAIESILSQSYPVTEIIIIDDGSNDDTDEVVKNMNSDKIKYLSQKNLGVSSARNLGLTNATSDYIAFLDADDIWHKNMIESQIIALEQHPDIVFCFTNFMRFSDKKNEVFSDQFTFYPELSLLKTFYCKSSKVHIILDNAFCALVEFGEIPAFTQVIMFRRTSLQGIRFNTELKVCEDLEFFLRASIKGKVAYNSTILAYIRRHANNVTKDFSLISQDKLKALIEFKKSNSLSTSMLKALDSRIAKSYIDVSSSLISKNQKLSGWKNFGKLLTLPGNHRKKAKGFLKLIRQSLYPR